VSYNKQETLALRGHLGSPPIFSEVRVLLIFLVFCVVVFLSLFFLFLSMLLDCPFGFLYRLLLNNTNLMYHDNIRKKNI